MPRLIEHGRYGKGEVVESRHKGFELRVKFVDDILRWVRRDELRSLTETPILSKPEAPKPKLPKEQFKAKQITPVLPEVSEPLVSKEKFKARQMIEAFRLGIVPYEHMEKFIFGRNKEMEQIENLLNNSNEKSLIITGEYGCGKTHLLEYVHAQALKNNWAVSLVELDPNELPFHKPKRIYEAIIRSFRFKKGEHQCDFREFLRTIARSNDSYELEGHEYLGRAIRGIRSGEDDEYFWEWIEGHPSGYSYPPMYEYSTSSNIYCYILSGIGWAARSIMGLNGFLILFDEAESIDPYWYSSSQNEKLWNFLKGLILMVNNDERLINEIRGRDSRSFRVSFGFETGLHYCGRGKLLPFLWKRPCYINILFAFVPHEILYEKKPINTVRQLEIENIGEDALKKIFETISYSYKLAYDSYDLNGDVFDKIPKDNTYNTRKFIKTCVEALDLIRFHPNNEREELLR